MSAGASSLTIIGDGGCDVKPAISSEDDADGNQRQANDTNQSEFHSILLFEG